MRLSDAPMDDMIVGMATLTAVTLSPMDNVPRNNVIAIHHLCRPSDVFVGLGVISMETIDSVGGFFDLNHDQHSHLQEPVAIRNGNLYREPLCRLDKLPGEFLRVKQ